MPTVVELEETWRAAARDFLFASLNGDTKARLDLLADRLFRARDAMRKGGIAA